MAGSRDVAAEDADGTAAVIVRAVLIGMLVVFVGTIPRNIVFAGNLRYLVAVPWAVPLMAAYLWFLWWYLKGGGPPASTAEGRRASLRANKLSGSVWAWALLAGGLGIVALVLGLDVVNRLVVLPQQELPDLAAVPRGTVLALLLMAAPIAGVVEEAAFRAYMQGPIERRCGLTIAILITGTMFALAHLDFTPLLWPYYVAVAAIYGTVTSLTNSILPAVVLHTGGNIYSNINLWLHGEAEWQTRVGPASLVWQTGMDTSFRNSSIALLIVSAAMVWAFRRLRAAAKRDR